MRAQIRYNNQYQNFSKLNQQL